MAAKNAEAAIRKFTEVTEFRKPDLDNGLLNFRSKTKLEGDEGEGGRKLPKPEISSHVSVKERGKDARRERRGAPGIERAAPPADAHAGAGFAILVVERHARLRHRGLPGIHAFAHDGGEVVHLANSSEGII